MSSKSRERGLILICPKVGGAGGLSRGTGLADCHLCRRPVWVEPRGRRAYDKTGFSFTFCFDCAKRGLDRLAADTDGGEVAGCRWGEGERAVLGYTGTVRGVPYELALAGVPGTHHRVIFATPSVLLRLMSLAAGITGEILEAERARRLPNPNHHHESNR